ncbi:MAG: methylamine utilization protein [Candidatus Rokuibacteriota bacterium]
MEGVIARPRRGLGLACALVVLGCLGPGEVATAATVDGRVTDQAGRAVEEAVVYATREGGGPSPTRPPAGAVMDQQNRMFVPHVLPVDIGVSVSFPNKDNIRHHVYSFSPPKVFELPLYMGVPATPVVFDKPGVVALGCNIHDWMLAYVYVVPTPYFAKSNAGGRAQLRDVPPGAYDVRVWHPRMRESPEGTSQRLVLAQSDTGQAVFVITLKPERPRRPPSPGGGDYRPPPDPR